jgi:hypothetical protein
LACKSSIRATPLTSPRDSARQGQGAGCSALERAQQLPAKFLRSASISTRRDPLDQGLANSVLDS